MAAQHAHPLSAPRLQENLAVGWFTGTAPTDPLRDGCCFVVHAAEGNNGEIWTRVADRCLSAFHGLQNLQVHYVVALRERGAVYYAATLEGAHTLPGLPKLRPIAIDPFNDDATLYAGVHQCALGQIGFRVDTRVQSVQVEQSPDFAALGTAHAGDSLVGEGSLAGAAQRGGEWRILLGDIQRGPRGAGATAASDALAVLRPQEASGLVHAVIDTGDMPGAAGLIWRAKGTKDYWLVTVSGDACQLERIDNGVATVVAVDHAHRLRSGAVHSLQATDASGQIGCYLDGERLFDRWFVDAAHEGEAGVGVWLAAGSDTCVREFEAHARDVALPSAIKFKPAWARLGTDIHVRDDFAATRGDLAGRAPSLGRGVWEKTVGIGILALEGTKAHVRATSANRNPGRTFYTLPWADPNFADLEVKITPPGTGRGDGNNGRGGLVFWQDKDNYISFSTWLDDVYEGASIALFTKRHGFEELYDAVWTMVGDKIYWGKPYRMRVAFDGNHFVLMLNDEPVMQRCLKDIYPEDAPLRIERIGMAVNWEWGDDAGSHFENFVGRSGATGSWVNPAVARPAP
ncbi:MAG: oxidoreductase [Hyphomicrobium sp.]